MSFEVLCLGPVTYCSYNTEQFFSLYQFQQKFSLIDIFTPVLFQNDHASEFYQRLSSDYEYFIHYK